MRITKTRIRNKRIAGMQNAEEQRKRYVTIQTPALRIPSVIYFI